MAKKRELSDNTLMNDDSVNEDSEEIDEELSDETGMNEDASDSEGNTEMEEGSADEGEIDDASLETRTEEESTQNDDASVTATVTSVALAVRDAASLDAGTIGYLNNGDTLPVIDSTSYRDWIVVDYNGKTAYLNRYYVRIN